MWTAVLACARPLVSDTIKGLPEGFDRWIYTWSDETEFRAAVEAALAEGSAAREARLEFAKTVRKDHSSEARTNQIVRKVHEIIGASESL